MKRDRLILLILAGGFFTTFLEVRYLHQEILRDERVAWIPIVLTPVLTLVSLLALARGSLVRTAALLFMSVGAIAGLAGFYFHSDGLELSHMTPYLTARVSEPGTVVARANGDEGEDGERQNRRIRDEQNEEPPLFAPLGITGLALIGLVTAWKRDERGLSR